MKGSYILIIRLTTPTKIKVGKLGTLEFKPGYYAYVGSAMNSIEARVRRHLRKTGKKLFWHIDYLLASEYAEVVDVLIKESNKKEECEIAGKLAERFESIPKFGCSDCKCKSHLFYLGSELPPTPPTGT